MLNKALHFFSLSKYESNYFPLQDVGLINGCSFLLWKLHLGIGTVCEFEAVDVKENELQIKYFNDYQTFLSFVLSVLKL